MMRSVVMPWAEAVEEYGDEWVSLVNRSGLNPTLLPAWIEISAQAYRPDEQLKVLICEKGDEVVALVPHFKARTRQLGLPVDVIELGTNIVSYHASLVSRAAGTEVLAELARTIPWHVLRLSNVAQDDPLAGASASVADENGWQLLTVPVEESPYLPIESDWEAYVATRPKKFRYKLRQRQKLLREDPRLRLQTYREGADVEHLYREILSIDRESWKARYGKDIGSNAQEKMYYSLLIPYLERTGALHADVLYYDDLPIAYSLCCRWAGWFGQLKTSFRGAYAELSPGSLVIDASIRAAFDSRAGEFDFLGDTDRHKSAWTTFVRSHRDHFLYAAKPRSALIAGAKRVKRRFFPEERRPSVKPE